MTEDEVASTGQARFLLRLDCVFDAHPFRYFPGGGGDIGTSPVVDDLTWEEGRIVASFDLLDDVSRKLWHKGKFRRPASEDVAIAGDLDVVRASTANGQPLGTINPVGRPLSTG